MGAGNFWDNQEKAQGIIQQLKPLNALVNEFEALEASAADLNALCELCAEDASLEADLQKELHAIEKKLAEFDLRAMFTGPQDTANAFIKISAGTPRSRPSMSRPISKAPSTSRSSPTISSATPSARAAPAGSTRTRPSPASATRTCQRASLRKVARNAASTRTMRTQWPS